MCKSDSIHHQERITLANLLVCGQKQSERQGHKDRQRYEASQVVECVLLPTLPPPPLPASHQAKLHLAEHVVFRKVLVARGHWEDCAVMRVLAVMARASFSDVGVLGVQSGLRCVVSGNSNK